jgi:arabinogalactan endo-1,4-beta-galactosidase
LGGGGRAGRGVRHREHGAAGRGRGERRPRHQREREHERGRGRDRHPSGGGSGGSGAGNQTGGSSASGSSRASGSSSGGGATGSSSTPSGSASSSTSASSGAKDAGSDASRADASTPFDPAFALGADITWTQQDTAGGTTYVDDDGTRKTALQIMKDHGFNYVRLRTFVDPTQSAPNPAGGTFAPYSTQGFADLAHTITFGQQIKAAGMGFLLDFHYSDTWADPGKQVKPSAWVADNFQQITAHLQAYTQSAISQLVAAGARPDMVQIGNEITPGMELSPGTAMGPLKNWSQLGTLLKAGIAGVHAVDPGILIMLHIDRGGDATSSLNFVTNAIAQGVQFDVFGESCYVAFQGQPSGWQTTFSMLVSKFPNLKFAIAEYNADPKSATELRTANDIVFNLPNKRGFGTFIWEPTHSGSWGPGLFTTSGNETTTIPASIDQYDQMKKAYAL